MPILKTHDELTLLDQANAIVHAVLGELERVIEPGISTLELDSIAERSIRRAGGVPAFLGYHGFPASLCTSINDEVVHGIPSASVLLRNGDIIGIDCGVFFRGYCGDAARTFEVGQCSTEARTLLHTTLHALQQGVGCAQVGGRLSDIGHAVQTSVESQGFSIVRDFVGHGIGASMHEDPQVPNCGRPGKGLRLESGLVLAIEPMVNAGRAAVKVDSDGWTARTKDGSLSAHFEVSVAITEDGPRILGLAGEALRRDGWTAQSAVSPSQFTKVAGMMQAEATSW